MKLKRQLNSKEIIVMIDSRATSFLCKRLIRKAQLLVSGMGMYNVVLGDGPVVNGCSIWHDVPIKMQCLKVVQVYIPLSPNSLNAVVDHYRVGLPTF